MTKIFGKKQKLEKLSQLLYRYAYEYYNNNNSIISDTEYDALTKEYYELSNKKFEYLGDTTTNKTVKHIIHVSSLDKVHTREEVKAAILKLAPVVIQPKIDGLTIVTYPDNTIVSRGDGDYGDNITETAKNIENMVYHSKYPIRSEAYVDKDTLKKINQERIENNLEPYKTARSIAAGIIRNFLNPERAKIVKYLAYDLLTDKRTEENKLKDLESINATIVKSKYFSKEQIEEAVDYVMNFDQDSLPYQIDGIVIKSNIEDARTVFGETGHHPKSAVAYKKEAEAKWTKLTDVEWNTGRTGRITPVAIFEPIELGGVTIKRATLHNVGCIEDLELSYGCEIEVAHSNEVIPVVIKSKNYEEENKINIPEICPVCKGLIKQEKDQIFCINETCKAKNIGNLIYLSSRKCLDITGLSEAIANKLLDMYEMSYLDIFLVEFEDLLRLDRMGEKSAMKLYQQIEKAKIMPLNKYIQIACIPGIGKKASTEIAKKLNTLENFLKELDKEDGFNGINGLGNILKETLIKNKDIYLKISNKYKDIKVLDVEKEINTNNNKILTFVITGTLDEPRSYYEEIILSHGHKVSSSVTKKTDYLLVGENAGSKLEKAKKNNINIIHGGDLMWILEPQV